ncbi:hypothetical protein Cni_G06171 [Canna indica]|uniref:Uncharacterized protein n=1 Tax=Canna indica TaxID=4628 RepID=A0AAQ3Q4H8_9LILI|nr:hypothetical protein Cni_G06171 [Canna indica]
MKYESYHWRSRDPITARSLQSTDFKTDDDEKSRPEKHRRDGKKSWQKGEAPERWRGKDGDATKKTVAGEDNWRRRSAAAEREKRRRGPQGASQN